MKNLVSLCLLLCLCMANLLPAQRKRGEWTYLKPEYKGVSFPTCWVRLEAQEDRLYILYTDYEQLFLTYSEDLGKSWQTELIQDFRRYPKEMEIHKLQDIEGENGKLMREWAESGYARIGTAKAEMKIDKEGGLHIAYLVSFDNSYMSSWISYAYRSAAGEWKYSEPYRTETGWMSYEVDLALDSKGHPHIVFQDSGELLLVKSDGGEEWERYSIYKYEISGRTMGINIGVSIAIDGLDRIHFGGQQINRAYLYARSDDGGATWHKETPTPPTEGELWFESDLEVDEFNRPHLTSRVLSDVILHGVKDDGVWRYYRATTVAANRGELFSDGRGGMYMAYYEGHGSYTGAPLGIASTQNYGLNWMNEVATTAASTLCSNTFADCATTHDRLYVAYHSEDSAVGLIYKPLQEVGLEPLTPNAKVQKQK